MQHPSPCGWRRAIFGEVRRNFQGPGTPCVTGEWAGGLELGSSLIASVSIFKCVQTLEPANLCPHYIILPPLAKVDIAAHDVYWPPEPV